MGSAINLHTIDSAISSVEVKTAAGQALAIDGSGYITANINGSVTVSATNLDIRDLTSASDSVEIKTAAGQALAIDGSGFITSNINGSVTVVDGGGSITVDGTVELGATTLAALESITVQNGAGAAAVNIQDGGNSITVDGSVTVSATDLDIRDLAFATDKVDVSGSSVSISGVVATSAGAYTGWKTQGVTVGATAALLVASAYAGRDEVVIQNLSNDDIYVGPDNTVTTSGATRGLKIARGTSQSVSLDASADIYAIGAVGSQAVAVAEYKY